MVRSTRRGRSRAFPRGAAGSALALALASAAALALVGVPLRSRLNRADRADQTRAVLLRLGLAAEARFARRGSWPASLADLRDFPGGDASPEDAWGRPWRLAADGETFEIVSAGADGRFDTADDLCEARDTTRLRRDETVARGRRIAMAIAGYNRRFQMSAPLPADWEVLRARLIERGLLPDSPDYAVDAWGDPFEEDPPGVEPVVRVRSRNLAPTP
ncbi:MAG TPA: hypothetical protein VMS76_00220 [Planctomycetota bacterium]|nr:hypothetical protein [Planctomycetota bacterium]